MLNSTTGLMTGVTSIKVTAVLTGMPLRSRLWKIGMDAQSHTGSAAPAKIANSVPLMRFFGKNLSINCCDKNS